MARKNPIREEDKAVARRLSEARASTLLGQTAAAKALGISRNQLVSYELATVPLPWGIGDNFCRLFGYSQRWLALGLVPKGIYAPLPANLSRELNPKHSFYNTICEIVGDLSAFYERLADRAGAPTDALDDLDKATFEFVGAAGTESWRGLVNAVTGVIVYDARHCPPDLHHAFYEHLIASSSKFMKKHQKAVEEYRPFVPPKPGG